MKALTPGQNGLIKFKAETTIDYAKEDVKMAKFRIGQEKKKDAIKHDRMMDKARLKQVLQKNKNTRVR